MKSHEFVEQQQRGERRERKKGKGNVGAAEVEVLCEFQFQSGLTRAAVSE